MKGAIRRIIAGTRVQGVLVGVVLFLSACAGDRGDAERPNLDFDIGMVTFAGYAPLHLAKAKGFFGELNVRLRAIEEISDIRAAMQSGDLEAYLATPDIAFDSDREPPGAAVWAIDESSGGDGVVVAGDIESLADLRGQQVAAQRGFPPEFILKVLLHEQGMALTDVVFRDLETQEAATAFVRGDVDAAGVWEPFLSAALAGREGSKIVASSADLPGLIVDLIFVRRDLLDRDDLIAPLIEGWNRALDYIEADPDDAYHIMSQAYGLEVTEFREIAAAVRWLGPEDNASLFGAEGDRGQLLSSMRSVLEVLKRNRSTVYPSVLDTYLSDRYVHAFERAREGR